MASLISAASFLIGIIFDLYIFVLILRLLLQKFGASWVNPMVQFIIKVTEPVIKPLRKFFPGFKGFDLAIVFVMFVLELIQMWLLVWLKFNTMPGIVGTMVVAVGQLGMKITNVFFWCVIINAIMSWFPAAQSNPMAALVNLIAEPVLRPARQLLPAISGIDLSPIITIIGLVLINMLIFNNIISFGMRLAFS